MEIDRLYEKLAAPAQRALKTLNIVRLEDLSGYTKAAIAGLHGIGPSAIRMIEKELASLKLGFLVEDEAGREGEAEGTALVDEYINGFSKQVRQRLQELRSLVKSVAPEAVERISYDMPAFYLQGYLAHYAGYKAHIGFYGSSGVGEELEAYRSGRGTLKFPADKALPKEALRKVLHFRVKENRRKALAAKKKKEGTA